LVKSESPAADYDYWTTKHGDVPSYQTSGEAEQAGTPLSLGESMILNAKQLLEEQVAEVKDESGVPNPNPRNAAMRRAMAASRRAMIVRSRVL
jgi:hypothetical protein